MAVIYDTPLQIELFKLLLMERALKWQATGRRLTDFTGPLPKGRTPLQILKKDYGIECRTAASALPAIRRLIVQQRIKVEDERTDRELA